MPRSDAQRPAWTGWDKRRSAGAYASAEAHGRSARYATVHRPRTGAAV